MTVAVASCVLSISKALKASTGISRWPPQTCAMDQTVRPCQTLPHPSTPSALPGRRCVCKYSGEAESGSPCQAHSSLHSTVAPQSIQFTVALETPAAVLPSSCLRISQNWMKETECSPEMCASQKGQHQRLSNLPSLAACIAHFSPVYKLYRSKPSAICASNCHVQAAEALKEANLAPSMRVC